MKRALITGITGQDGSYLADLLLEKGYEVHGIIRRASTFNTSRIDHLYADPHVNGVRLFLHYGDLSDSVNLVKLLYELKPDEIYHLGAQSHVRVSFDIPEYTADVTAVGTIRILEAIREAGLRSRFYQDPAAKCSARRNKCRKVRKRHSGRGVPTVWPRFFLIGPLLTTVKAMAFSPAMAFCLITKPTTRRNFCYRKNLTCSRRD